MQFKGLDDGDALGPARQRFDPKHQVVLQCRIPWQAAKVVPEPRPTNLEPLRALSLTQRFIEALGYSVTPRRGIRRRPLPHSPIRPFADTAPNA